MMVVSRETKGKQQLVPWRIPDFRDKRLKIEDAVDFTESVRSLIQLYNLICWNNVWMDYDEIKPPKNWVMIGLRNTGNLHSPKVLRMPYPFITQARAVRHSPDFADSKGHSVPYPPETG